MFTTYICTLHTYIHTYLHTYVHVLIVKILHNKRKDIYVSTYTNNNYIYN